MARCWVSIPTPFKVFFSIPLIFHTSSRSIISSRIRWDKIWIKVLLKVLQSLGRLIVMLQNKQKLQNKQAQYRRSYRTLIGIFWYFFLLIQESSLMCGLSLTNLCFSSLHLCSSLCSDWLHIQSKHVITDCHYI